VPEVLVVDAEPVFVVGASAVLVQAGLDAQVADPRAVAQAGGAEHREPAQPDPGPSGAMSPVIVLDGGLAGTAGLASLVSRAHQAWPGSPVVLILRREEQGDLLTLLGSGVRALLHRRCQPGELVAAVRAAGAGQTWVAPVLAASVRAELLAERAGDRSAVLSPREVAVLRLMATGATNAAIGRSLGISHHTVRNHVHAVLAKLGAANRTDAVALAARRGMVEISG
jgi:DNA-binding NarL/FixJ family response regulator